jgi:molecular chaperone IbpA
VAGFAEGDLDIQVQENVLTISGKRVPPADSDSRNFLHRGIAERSFERRFHLADNVEVRDAELLNGLLQVRLEREIPEEKKPRQISINGKSDAKLIQGGKADAA